MVTVNEDGEVVTMARMGAFSTQTNMHKTFNKYFVTEQMFVLSHTEDMTRSMAVLF